MNTALRRLRRGERTAGIAGIVLAISLFTSWYGLEISVPRFGTVPIPSVTTDAWDAFSVIDVLLALTAVVAIGLAFAQARFRAPAVPVALSIAGIWLGAISVLAILFRIIDPPGPHLSVQGGAWVGLIASSAITAGCWLSLRTEGVRPADERTEIETVTLTDAAPPAAR